MSSDTKHCLSARLGKMSSGCYPKRMAIAQQTYSRFIAGEIELNDIRPEQVNIFLNGTGPITASWHVRFNALLGTWIEPSSASGESPRLSGWMAPTTNRAARPASYFSPSIGLPRGIRRAKRLAAMHALAYFIGPHSPEHLEWCGQIRAIPENQTSQPAHDPS